MVYLNLPIDGAVSRWYSSSCKLLMNDSPVVKLATRLDLSDGKILTTMECLMVFAKVPL